MNFKLFTFVQSPPVAIISQPSQRKSTSQPIGNASPPAGFFITIPALSTMSCRSLEEKNLKQANKKLQKHFSKLVEIR
jgi:hypothetical protein